MSATTYHKLNNPAWYSLAETHKDFAIGNDEIKRYQKDIAPFLAYLSDEEDAFIQPDQFVDINDSFFIIGDLPALPNNYTTESKLLCVQMICAAAVKINTTAAIEELGKADDAQMTALINLVQPGYYKPGTRLMGDYFGIRVDGQLVSMTGERMRMKGFTEISAVVTHPEFTGRKYAQQLVGHTVNKNIDAGVIPFLHVAQTNERAIKIYEHLGFFQRRIIVFWKIKREG
jgi:ribosomal protein S18 acetylase RimI-like enzyme